MCQSTAGARSGAAVGAGSTSASCRFPAATTSVGQARRFLIEQLPEGSDKGADALVLMLSELATNAVQHAATEFEVSVHIAADASSVRVEVSDDAGGYPTPQEPVGDAPHGRGLHIVRTLADAWGIEMHRHRAGKTVWFSSALPASDRPVTEAVTEPSSGRAGPDGNGAAESPAPPVGTAAVAIVATDERGQIRYANVAAEDLMGWPHGSLVGRSALDLVHLPAAVGVEVGGDWYDVVPITERLVALVVGDVEGHDLEAAKIMSRLRHTLGLLVLEEQAPGKALQRLNQVSLSGVGPRLATALIGVLDTATGMISFASAGHPSPVRVESGQAHELPVPPGPPLGVQHCDYKDHEFRLDRGCVMMFTDGLVERRGTPLDERLELLETSLRASPNNEPGPVADLIIDAMTAGDRSSDDIVVLTACRRDGDAAPC
ncbi:MAG: SpoIIE family protein phosphatase [Acidimicrobiales bacterium]